MHIVTIEWKTGQSHKLLCNTTKPEAAIRAAVNWILAEGWDPADATITPEAFIMPRPGWRKPIEL